MKRILTAVVLIPLVLLVLFKAPLWLFTLVVGVVAMGAAWEYLRLVDAYGFESIKSITMTVIAFVFAYLLYESANPGELRLIWMTVAILGLPFFLLVSAMGTDDLSKALPRASMSALAIPYVLLTLLCLPMIRSYNTGIFLIFFMFAVVWSGDVFAYYFGRTLGKHKLAPRISPGKTWEGTAASFIGSVFLAHIIFVDSQQIMEGLYRLHLVSIPVGLAEPNRHIRLVHGLILGAFVNVAAQIGDLVESMIKRGAGAKDSGTLLPGHGGILDRIDALLFAAPVVALYALMTQTVGVY